MPNCKVWCKDKSTLIWYETCLIWIFFGWKTEILLSYLKSTPRICRIAQFRARIEISKLGAKNAFFWCFWDKVLIKFCRI